jgi:hypothetical protein
MPFNPSRLQKRITVGWLTPLFVARLAIVCTATSSPSRIKVSATLRSEGVSSR